MNYVSLHNHTTFSIGDGLIKPMELFERAAQFDQPAVAVTDHGTFAGMWDCLKASRKTGVKMIAGCEFYFVEDVSKPDTQIFHLVLLAKNATGYRNLLTLNKLGYDQGDLVFKKAISRIDWALLEKYRDGLICTTACGNGIVGQAIMAGHTTAATKHAERLQHIFGDDLALELQPHNLQRQPNSYSGPVNQQKINLALKKISEELGIRCIVATDARYLEQEHHDLHDVLLCIVSGQPRASGQRLKYDKPDFYFKSAEQVAAYFERHKKVWGEDFIQELFDNTIYLADKCEPPEWIDLKYSNPSGKELPEFNVQEQDDYEEFLSWKGRYLEKDLSEDVLYYRYGCEQGLNQKLADGKLDPKMVPEYQARIKEELEVLEYHGFSSYMLIVADYVKWARDNGIAVGPGRGSVGGCFTAYLHDIHRADPFKYGMIFSRFHNKEKTSFPDIDLDFAPSGRDRVHAYIKQKYGDDYVAQVSNFNTITPKVYAKDIARVFEFGGMGRSAAAEIGAAIADSIPSDMKTVRQALEHAPLFAEFAKQYPELAMYADLSGKARNWGTHAAGLVISSRPLTGLVPVRRDNHGNFALEYEKERAEEVGLVKMDTLGLTNLDIISKTYDLMEANGKERPPEPFDYEQEDSNTYDLISSGDTFGVFQLASVATPVCKLIKPRDVYEIALVTALIRPAAKEIIPDFAKVRSGEKPLELLHPRLQRAFGKTYGFGLFEESLMYLAQDVAGWDLHKADGLRKMTKAKGKYPEKVKKLREDFIEDGQKNGIDEETVTKIWDDVVAGFGGYGFNTAHAVFYSMISFHTAWLKANYPLEFLVANLMFEVNSNQKQAKDNMLRIKEELRSRNVKIVPPDINTSEMAYKIVDDTTLMTGLDALKYMGKDAIPELLAKRPYTSFEDMMYRLDASKVRAPTIQALAASGSLDAFKLSRKKMFFYASDYRAKLKVHMNRLVRAWAKENKLKAKEITLDQVPEDRKQDHLKEFKYPFPKERDWNVREMFALEEYYMGEGISGSVFERYNGFLRRNVFKFSDLPRAMPYTKRSDDERDDRKQNSTNLASKGLKGLKGIISTMFVFTVKKEDSRIFGQEMCRMNVQDPYGHNLSVIAFPGAWQNMQHRIQVELSGGKGKIEPGIAIFFRGVFQWENAHTYSFILDDILDYKPSPSLPEDLKSRKVKMPRAKKVTTKESEELDKIDLAEMLEDEMVEVGEAPIDDEDDVDKLPDPFTE